MKPLLLLIAISCLPATTAAADEHAKKTFRAAHHLQSFSRTCSVQATALKHLLHPHFVRARLPGWGRYRRQTLRNRKVLRRDRDGLTRPCHRKCIGEKTTSDAPDWSSPILRLWDQE